MAYNLLQFNQAPYNAQTSHIKYLSVSALEDVDAVVGSALNFYPLAIGNERVNETSEIVKCRFISASGTETVVEQVIEAQMTVILFPHFEESITAETAIAAVIMPLVTGAELVSASDVLDADIYPVIGGEEVIEAETSLGTKIYPIAEGYELVSESASLENIEMKTCVLTVTLKPGDILIVDANNYNVLLNSENAIDTQSGDWIDDMSRNTTDISITASAGMNNLDATILYTERYL